MSDWKCPECGKGYEDHPSLDVSHVTSVQVCGNRVIAPEVGDRHPKWHPVEPGTVIPAGQPYRVEQVTCNYEFPGKRSDMAVPFYRGSTYFIDSSWKPPLVLPTEPTWGIAIQKVGAASTVFHLGQWYRDDGWFRSDVPCDRRSVNVDLIVGFIECTDEQVARIEAAR